MTIKHEKSNAVNKSSNYIQDNSYTESLNRLIEDKSWNTQGHDLSNYIKVPVSNWHTVIDSHKTELSKGYMQPLHQSIWDRSPGTYVLELQDKTLNKLL